MAILKVKKLIEDLQNNTSQVVASVTKVAATASYAGTAAIAGTANLAGTLSGSQLHGGAGTHTY